MGKELSRKINSGDSFGARLKRLRLQKRLSLKEMANAVGVPVTTYREWEYGRAIKGEPYAKIAEVLDVSIAELLTGETLSKAAVLKHIALIEEHLKDLRKELERMFDEWRSTPPIEVGANVVTTLLKKWGIEL